MSKSLFAGAAPPLLAALPAAEAHVTLESQEAAVGTTYKAVLRVPHGCDGSPTVALEVEIPEGVIGVKPMPEAGWQLEIVTGPYGRTYDYYGHALSEGARRIVWSGGSLPDAFYDEFVLRGFLAEDLEPGATLLFPVVQRCEAGERRWTEPPAEAGHGHGHGAGHGDPAPGLRLLPPR